MFRNFALKLALKKPSPNRYFPASEKNDFYEVKIEIPESKIILICNSESKDSLKGLLWVDGDLDQEGSIPKSKLETEKWSMTITHYYKGLVQEYDSSFRFCAHHIFYINHILYSRKKLSQAAFNKHKLVRLDRIKVLHHLLEKDKGTTPESLCEEINSKLWSRHPEQRSIQNYYRLVFESLVCSGDLLKDNFLYKISPHALKTISEHVRDEQKHIDNLNNAKKTRNLTYAIIGLGSFNLAFQVFKWFCGNTPPP